MYSLDYTGKFKKDLKQCERRGYDMILIRTVIKYMEEHGQAPQANRPHRLHGKLSGFWECHIDPDWVLIYDIQQTIQLVTLARTGTHSDLLSKK